MLGYFLVLRIVFSLVDMVVFILFYNVFVIFLIKLIRCIVVLFVLFCSFLSLRQSCLSLVYGFNVCLGDLGRCDWVFWWSLVMFWRRRRYLQVRFILWSCFIGVLRCLIVLLGVLEEVMIWRWMLMEDWRFWNLFIWVMRVFWWLDFDCLVWVRVVVVLLSWDWSWECWCLIEERRVLR